MLFFVKSLRIFLQGVIYDEVGSRKIFFEIAVLRCNRCNHKILLLEFMSLYRNATFGSFFILINYDPDIDLTVIVRRGVSHCKKINVSITAIN